MTSRVSALAPWTLLLERNFLLFWLSQLISVFGDQITVIALAGLVWRLTGSSLYTALAVIVTTIPHAVFGFLAGPIADAIGRRRTLVLCDLVRVVVIAAIPLVLALNLPLVTVFILVLVASASASLFTPTKLALLPDLVRSGKITAGYSFIQVSDRTVEIAGKAVAGILFLALSTEVFLLDAATFMLSAVLLSRLSLKETAEGRVSFGSVLADAGTGLRVIGESEVLASNLLFSLIAQMSLAVLNTLTPVYLFREFAAGTDAFGVAEAAIACGVVVSGVFVPSLIARRPKGSLVTTAFAAYGVLLVGLAVARSLDETFLLFFLCGVANAVFLIPNITIYQEHTPAEFRGRVFSTRYALLNLVWLPVMVVSGALAETMSTALLIGIAGVFTLMVAIVGWRIPAIRDVR